MPRAPLPLLRLLKLFSSGLWIGFLLWSALATGVWSSGLGEAAVKGWLRHHYAVIHLLAALLEELDLVWLTLAALICYRSLAASEGMRQARAWSVALLAVSVTLSALAVSTGWPLAPVLYTERLGPALFSVPLGVPLLWCVVIFGGRQALRRLWPRAGHVEVAVGTGLLAALTAWNLQPIASHARVWWLWRPADAPWLLYTTWGVAGAGLAGAFRSGGSAGRREGWQASAALGILNALALLARLGQYGRS